MGTDVVSNVVRMPREPLKMALIDIINVRIELVSKFTVWMERVTTHSGKLVIGMMSNTPQAMSLLSPSISKPSCRLVQLCAPSQPNMYLAWITSVVPSCPLVLWDRFRPERPRILPKRPFVGIFLPSLEML